MARIETLPLLDGLTSTQRHAVVCEEGRLCVMAPAGSGKTRVLTRRVARRVLDGSADPERVLVVTFTRRAAWELRRRLATMGTSSGIRAGTFHAIAYAELRRHYADTARQIPVLVESPHRLLASMRGMRMEERAIPAVAAEIQWAQARLVSPGDYGDQARATQRSPVVGYDFAADAFALYEAEKRRKGVMDLGDLLSRCAHILLDDPAARDAWRWRVRHLFVDELQDINPAQWRLLTAFHGGGDDIFLVGDPDQAIYSWNGSDPTVLGRITEMLPGTTVVRLDANHRCSPQILRAAQAVLDNPPEVESTRPDGTLPRVESFPDSEAEADAVIRWLRLSHRPGRPWSQLAVLARTNSRLIPVARALERAGIPYRTGTSSPAPVVADGDEEADAGDGNTGEAGEADTDGVGANSGIGASQYPAGLNAGTNVRSRVQHGGGVELATFHRAKGLEWHAVAIIGLEDGVLPDSRATTPETLAEERRLLYVAVTRAADDLWCSWAATRVVGSATVACRPSPFLDALSRACAGPSRRPSRQDLTNRLAELRLRLQDAADGSFSAPE
ncbi:MAG: ATP-dependent helicase [Acidimicrobiales bacterium]